MNVKNKNHGIKNAIIIAVTLALALGINQFSTNSVPTNYFLVFGGAIIVFIFSLYFIESHWLISMIKKMYLPEIDGEYREDSYLGKSSHQCIICPGRYCSASDLMDSEFYDNALDTLKIDEDKLEGYKLVTDEEFNILEKTFFDNHEGGEIWVLSVALETEIELDEEVKKGKQSDPSLRQSMELVKQNIAAGNRYVQFVALGVQADRRRYLGRRKKYWEALKLSTDEERQEKMPIIRIDSNILKKREDWTFMIQLTSTVLFQYKTGECEGYICLRPESKTGRKAREYRTIFYKMPTCIADDLTAILEKKMDSENNQNRTSDNDD